MDCRLPPDLRTGDLSPFELSLVKQVIYVLNQQINWPSQTRVDSFRNKVVYHLSNAKKAKL